MTRPRRFWLIPLAALGIGASLIVWNDARRPSKPNVLLVTLDTTRADRLGCYGYTEALTPTLDELSRRGVLFENAYTPVPLTLPAHATILTGLLPPEHGLHLNGQGTLDTEIPVLAEILSRNGYKTSAFIASFILNSRFGLHRGFETYDDDLGDAEKGDHGAHRLRSGRQIVESALAWLRQPRDAPFFCWVHLVDPHLPCQEHTAEFGPRFEGRPYDAEVAYADSQIRRLTEHLRTTGLLERTLIVIVGDHGEGLGEHREPDHGYMVYNTTMRVPLLFHSPHLLKTPVRVSTPVSLIDLFPTLLEYTGIAPPQPTGGRSLKPALNGGALKELPCYGESDAPLAEGGWSPVRSLTTSRWKYIRSVRPELYDLAADPAELNNLFDQHPAEAAELEQDLATLEGGLERRSAGGAKLSESEQRLLSGLGYIRGKSGGKRAAAGAALRDIKDMIQYPDWVEEGMGLISAGELARAEAKLREVVSGAPDYAKALGTLGVCLAQQKKEEEAAGYFERALAIDPNLDFVQFAFGQLLLDRRHPAEALVHFSEALRQNPDAPLSHYFSAEAARQLGDITAAREHYETALRLNPDLAQAQIGLGNLAVAQNDLAQGIVHYESAVRINPHLAETHERLAAALVKQRRFKEALREYSAAFERDPKHVPTLVGFAHLLASAGDAKVRDGAKGIRLAERACRLTESKAFEPLDALAAGYAETGKWKEAVEAAESALALARAAEANEAAAAIAARLKLFQNEQPYRLGD
jgi:arylsulfatase A-like enzyme/Tfp pilus assembly protein PilF